MTEHISYSLLNPTGNITLLAETSVPTESQPAIARRLMELEPATEQVGFVRFGEGRAELRMAGGEFCGNAAMSAAVLCAEIMGAAAGNITVRVCGTEKPVQAAVERLDDGRWRGTVGMPEPLSVGREEFPDGRVFPVVRFPGITHVLLEEKMEKSAAEALAPAWCRILDAEALGLMFLDREKKTMTPLVYVPGAGTLCWESSCASGTTAVGACLAAESGRDCILDLKQPGGTLGIRAVPEGLYLTGTVRILRRCADAEL